ncbi:hypothetical protein NPIL_326541 [Nephila pilipes]|uniref:Uncharacterized protein n=1 Tax=Nephila pilipes TaxID=299642 RepID=A0A8X6TLS4_NEPPI|nr:hypothetical protein NPIL_326541 [Nephila pilipes]
MQVPKPPFWSAVEHAAISTLYHVKKIDKQKWSRAANKNNKIVMVSFSEVWGCRRFTKATVDFPVDRFSVNGKSFESRETKAKQS